MAAPLKRPRGRPRKDGAAQGNTGSSAWQTKQTEAKRGRDGHDEKKDSSTSASTVYDNGSIVAKRKARASNSGAVKGYHQGKSGANGNKPINDKGKDKARERVAASSSTQGSSRSSDKQRVPRHQERDDAQSVDQDEGESSYEHDSSDGSEAEEAASDVDLSSDAAAEAQEEERRPGRPRGRSLRKWRRLAVEERELLTSEGGLIWQAMRPALAQMRPREVKEARTFLAETMYKLDAKLESKLVPPTPPLPHGARAAPGPNGAQVTASIPGSLISWREERGGRVYEDMDDDGNEEEDEGRRDDSRREPATRNDPDATITQDSKNVAGFAADIALLEGLLLPEAAEAVSLTRALHEQERELSRMRDVLGGLRASYQSTRLGDDAATRDLNQLLTKADSLLNEGSSSKEHSASRANICPITFADDASLREAAQYDLQSSRIVSHA